MSSETDSEEVAAVKRGLAVKELLRGKSRDDVAAHYGFSTAEMFRIEEDYYKALQPLDEHALLMKQLTRLETVLDAVWDQVMDRSGFVDPDDLKGILAVITEISDLAGLKKQRVSAEVKIIQDQQVDMVAAYVEQVLNAYTEQLFDYLTVKGKRALEGHQDEWIAEAVAKPVQVLEGTATMTV